LKQTAAALASVVMVGCVPDIIVAVLPELTGETQPVDTNCIAEIVKVLDPGFASAEVLNVPVPEAIVNDAVLLFAVLASERL